jgi:protein TonB
MTSPRTFVAILISLVLHAALLAAVMSGIFSAPPKPPAANEPMTVVLLEPPKAEPVSLPAAPPPAPAKPPPEKKKATPKPKPKPVAPPVQPLAQTPKEMPAPPVAAPSPPAPQAQAEAPSAPPAQATAPTPAPPAPPVKTGVSIGASYRASNRQPVQPPMSVRYGEQGTVMLQVLVKADGTAGSVDIKKSSGFPLLDEAARTTVQTWRFNPATVDGKPVQEWYVVPVTFTLKN